MSKKYLLAISFLLIFFLSGCAKEKEEIDPCCGSTINVRITTKNEGGVIKKKEDIASLNADFHFAYSNFIGDYKSSFNPIFQINNSLRKEKKYYICFENMEHPFTSTEAWGNDWWRVYGYTYSLRLSNEDIQYLALDKKVAKAKLSRTANCSDFKNMDSLEEYKVTWWINDSSDKDSEVSIIDYFKTLNEDAVALEIAKKENIGERFDKIISAPDIKTFEKELDQYLSSGFSINQSDEYSKPILARAAFKNNTEQVRIILEKGAKPNFVIRMNGSSGNVLSGWMGEMRWIREIEIVKLLVSRGVDVNSVDSEGTTPIWYAQTAEIAKFLLDSGANVCVKNRSGENLIEAKKGNSSSYASQEAVMFLKSYIEKCN
jgi:ankyrin repeat protein